MDELERRTSLEEEYYPEVGPEVLKMALGMIPGIGPILATWFSIVLPNAQLQRLETLANYYAASVSHLPIEYIQQKFRDPQFTGLFEQGMYAASKALLGKRIRVISNFLSNGTKEGVDVVMAQSYLEVVSDLTDTELLVLLQLIKEKDKVKPSPQIHIRVDLLDHLVHQRFGAELQDTDEYMSCRFMIDRAIHSLNSKSILGGTTVHSPINDNNYVVITSFNTLGYGLASYISFPEQTDVK